MSDRRTREEEFYDFYINYGKIYTVYDSPYLLFPVAIKVSNNDDLLSYYIEDLYIKNNNLYIKINDKSIIFKEFIKEYFIVGFNNQECMENPDVDYIKFNSLLRRELIDELDCFSKVMLPNIYN